MKNGQSNLRRGRSVTGRGGRNGIVQRKREGSEYAGDEGRSENEPDPVFVPL